MSWARGRTPGARGGAVAGVFGGAVLSIFLAVVSAAEGRNVWLGAKAAALPLLGERVSEPGFATLPVLVGLAVHVAISAAWGTIFGLVVYRASRAVTVLLGVPFGVVVWLAMFLVVLPLAERLMRLL